MTEIEVYARSSVANIPAIVLWLLLATLITGFAIIYLNLNSSANHNYWWCGLARLLLVEWVVMILCTTVVFRDTRPESAITLIPLSSYFFIAENSYLKEVAVINLMNVVMFVPVGFLMKCSFRNMTWKHILLMSFILSSSVELLQLVFCKGLCEIDDIIHNVFGSLIGYLAVHVILNLK